MDRRPTLLAGLAPLLFAAAAGAQSSPPFPVPATNPKAVVHQQVAATDIEVTYSRPAVRGRVIFGGLVPWGQVWRTGADAATRISFSTPVAVNGTPVEAGSYELFTIPGPDQWVVIFQRARAQWGSYAYDSTHDVARVLARPRQAAEPVERFTISVDDITADAARLHLSWDRVRVPLEITIDLRATVVPRLEAALRAEGRRPYFQAAMFYYETGLDLPRAAELIALALEGNPTHIGMLHRQALILEKTGDLCGAHAAATRSLAGTATAPPELRDEYTRLNVALLARLPPC